MLKKLLGTFSVGFDVTGELLIVFHFFGFLSVQYLNYISVFQLIALN